MSKSILRLTEASKIYLKQKQIKLRGRTPTTILLIFITPLRRAISLLGPCTFK